MPTKRDVLERLRHNELIVAVDSHDLRAASRRRGELIEAVASCGWGEIREVLAELPRERLKQLCRALDLDDSGRDKAVLVDRLSGTKRRRQRAQLRAKSGSAGSGERRSMSRLGHPPREPIKR